MKPTLLLTVVIILIPTLSPANPPALPEQVIVAGAAKKSGNCLQPWTPQDAKDITGEYDCYSITDGSSSLTVTAHGAGNTMTLSGTVTTRWVDETNATIRFSGADCFAGEQPGFTVSRSLITGWFVRFTDPDKPSAAAQTAVVIGGDIYVRREPTS